MNYELLKQHINPEPNTILDIGAHRGEFTSMCGKQFPNASFFLIEAEEYHKHMLVAHKHLIAYLSDVSEEKTFYKTRFMTGNSGDSFYKENTNYYSIDGVIEEKVKTTTLDEIFVNGEVFDFVKIDTQGSELDILKGGVNLLKNTYAFLLEVSLSNYNIGAPKKEEVTKYMEKMGFTKQIVISEIYNNFDNKELIQQDVLFLK